MPVAIPLIGAGIGAAGSIYASNQAKKGQEKAAYAASQGAEASLAEQRRQYDLSRADMAPWLNTGRTALGSYANLLGQNGSAQQQQAMSQFQASPDYNFRQSEQMRALTARNSALGIQDSGAAQKAALRYSGNLASGEFNTYANRLAALAGVGQTAAGQNAQIGQNYAGAVTGINTNLGQQLGSSYQNVGAINGQLGQQLAGIGTGLFQNLAFRK